MNLPEDCDQEQLRQSYLNLVKKYHPDSGSPEADSVVFQEVRIFLGTNLMWDTQVDATPPIKSVVGSSIFDFFAYVENAYRNLQRKMSKERYNHQQCAGEYGLYYTEKEEAQEFDIKHTAPQHRQYLSYGGYGAGTPAQREKQFRKYRAVTAAENVYNHRINKLANQMEDGLLVKDKKEAKKIKTSCTYHLRNETFNYSLGCFLTADGRKIDREIVLFRTGGLPFW
ncbi:hypothetical protein J437_LFUL013566 [Ladona fulva]|uniref:J domain-containing protein n=1 Tax=Ladona fulva TaxID=123851 RepID=A0A8K0KFS5_LADFU|nr:hypothetical protein J437_LFUL013566 [Ladona fulva]